MSTRFYLQGFNDCIDGTTTLGTTTLKIMLLGTANTTYVFDPLHSVVDNGADDSTDPSFCELVATNYTGGFGGAGRKTATISFNQDTANAQLEKILADLTWSALGGATNDTVTAAILIKEGTADTDSRLICYFENPNQTTNGADFKYDFAADGNYLFNV